MSTSWRSTSTSTKGSSYNSSLKHSSQVNYIICDIHMTAKMLNLMTRFCLRYADAYDRRDRSGRPEGSSGCCVKIRTLHPLQWTSHWRRAHRRQRQNIHRWQSLSHLSKGTTVTVNKNAHNLQHHFGAQFFMLFHMVWFILFGVLGRESTFSLVEVL